MHSVTLLKFVVNFSPWSITSGYFLEYSCRRIIYASCFVFKTEYLILNLNNRWLWHGNSCIFKRIRTMLESVKKCTNQVIAVRYGTCFIRHIITEDDSIWSDATLNLILITIKIWNLFIYSCLTIMETDIKCALWFCYFSVDTKRAG